MSNIDQDDKGEPKLDPTLEKVRRKMIRLQVVSASVMVVSFLAVMIAIVYKANHRPEASPAQTPVAQEVPTDGAVTAKASLPDGFSVSGMQLSNGQILFDGKSADGTRKALVFDISRGRIVADITVAKP